LKNISLPEINHFLAALTVIVCFLPCSIIWRRRLFFFKPYLLVSIFWAINGIVYFPEIFNWGWYAKTSEYITYGYNLLETCQIILIFYFIFQKIIFKYLIFLFVLFEVIIIIYTQGYRESTDNIIIGTGSFISLILNIGAIIQYILKFEPSNSEHALTFLYVGFIFYFMQFMIIFEYNYLQKSNSALPYLNTINYLSICIAISIISFGMIKFPVSHGK
jgi:hypothetical protein